MSNLARSFLAVLLAVGVTLLTTNVDAILDHTVPFDPTAMIATFVVVLILVMVLLRTLFPTRKSEDGFLSEAKGSDENES